MAATDRHTCVCVCIYIYIERERDMFFQVDVYVTFDLKLSKLFYFVRMSLTPLANTQIKQNSNILTKL